MNTNTAATILKLRIADIDRSVAELVREKLCKRTMREYADDKVGGATLPPILVFCDTPAPPRVEAGEIFGFSELGKIWLADGSHRLGADDLLEIEICEAEVHTGGRAAALAYALRANDGHGLRRTPADKRKAVLTALEDDAMRGMSDREIARACGVSAPFVAKVRVNCNRLQLTLEDAGRIGRDGKRRGLPVKKTAAHEKNATSTPGGSGGAASAVKFNAHAESFALVEKLQAEMAKWPAEKRHSFAVHLREFANERDPEVLEEKARFRAQVRADRDAAEGAPQ